MFALIQVYTLFASTYTNNIHLQVKGLCQIQHLVPEDEDEDEVSSLYTKQWTVRHD